MKVATHNVNGINSRLPRLLEWLEREQPDLACLQEVRALDAGLPQAELLQACDHVLWKGQRAVRATGTVCSPSFLQTPVFFPADRASSSRTSARASSPSGMGLPLSRHCTAALKPSACA